ncbi:MAG: protein phosphatase 2C domain-containing protein [Clostridiales bacterium]|nr:protein phosphatase 2C domain-containing protein [Clostridiales bacterium]
MLIKEVSETGAYHNGINGENQDFLSYAQNRNFSVISLADGVSTCKEARRGAEIASGAITDLFLKRGASFMKFEGDRIAGFALSHILHELEQESTVASESIEEYSSTVASVLADKKNRKIMCFNLGDGIILGTGNERCRVLVMPDDSSNGCCVTTTRGASASATVKIIDIGSMESVLICSDGAWRLMYEKGKLREEAADLLKHNEFDGLKEFLARQNAYDDYSIILLDLRQRRKVK